MAPLFDDDFLRRLEQLRLITARAAGGRFEGARLGGAAGGRVELRGHRHYSPGDDLRFVDWNLYARLEKLFVKEFAREEASAVTVLIDASASMAVGRPSKFTFSARLGAALATIALASLDSVRVGTFAAGAISPMPPRTGAGAIYPVMDQLAKGKPAGRTGLSAALKNAAGVLRESGTLIVISDFWEDSPKAANVSNSADPNAPALRSHVSPELLKSIRMLAERGFDLVLVQVLSRDELEPPRAGRYALVDSETTDELELTLTEAARDEYRALISGYADELDRHAARYGLRMLHLVTDFPFEQGLIEYLRDARMVK